MKRRLLDRIEELETRIITANSLTNEQAMEFAATARSNGKSEAEVFDLLDKSDPSLLTRGIYSVAQYAVCDQPLLRLPNQWAARHKNPFIAIVGRLDDGGFSVLVPGGNRHPLKLPTGVDWRQWDPVAVHFLGWLVHHKLAWSTFWSRPKDFRAKVGIAEFYIGTAKKRAERLVRDEDSEVLGAYRETLEARIDWILEQTSEPTEIPWLMKECAA